MARWCGAGAYIPGVESASGDLFRCLEVVQDVKFLVLLRNRLDGAHHFARLQDLEHLRQDGCLGWRQVADSWRQSVRPVGSRVVKIREARGQAGHMVARGRTPV